MNRCPTCGTTYADEARFCTRDGSQARGAPDDAPSATPARGTLSGRAEPAEPRRRTRTWRARCSTAATRSSGRSARAACRSCTSRSDVATQERYAIKVLSAALSQDENAMARLQARGEPRHAARAPERLPHHPAGRDGGRARVRRDAVRRRARSSPTATTGWARCRSTRSCGSCSDIAAGLQRRARAQDRASRPEARERHDLQGRRRHGARGRDGLRAGEGTARRRRAAEAHRDGDHPRHAGVHEPRAAARQAARRAHRHLLAGADDLRDAHRQAAVRRAHAAGDDDRAPAQRADAAAPGAAGARTCPRRWSACC